MRRELLAPSRFVCNRRHFSISRSEYRGKLIAATDKKDLLDLYRESLHIKSPDDPRFPLFTHSSRREMMPLVVYRRLIPALRSEKMYQEVVDIVDQLPTPEIMEEILPEAIFAAYNIQKFDLVFLFFERLEKFWVFKKKFKWMVGIRNSRSKYIAVVETVLKACLNAPGNHFPRASHAFSILIKKFGQSYIPKKCFLLILQVSGQAGQVEECFKLFNMMEERFSPLDIRDYTILIQALLRKKQFDVVYNIVECVKKSKVPIDVFLCRKIATELMHNKHFEALLEFTESLREERFLESCIFLNSYLLLLCNEGGLQNAMDTIKRVWDIEKFAQGSEIFHRTLARLQRLGKFSLSSDDLLLLANIQKSFEEYEQKKIRPKSPNN